MDLREICRTVAEGLPGATVTVNGEILYRRRGLSARVEFPESRTEFLFDVGSRMEASIQAAPSGLWHDVKALFGVHDFRVGDPDFDRAFEVRTSNDPFAARILTVEIRSLLRSAALEGNILWRVSKAGFLLRIPRRPDRTSELERWLSVALQLLDGLPGIRGFEQEAPAEVDLEPVEQRVADDTECQVCDTSLAEGSVVTCVKCATPHHRDCWVFNGRCSTFGCGWLGFR